MNSTRLQDIKQDCARIVIQYSNGYCNARMSGTRDENDIHNDLLRVHYLYSIIKNCFLSGTDVYVGDTIIADNIVETILGKIWHYNGVYADVAMSDYAAITPDDGDGGATDPCTPTQDSDHYRSGNLAATIGANVVTFIKDGVASPLASSDYTVDAWVIANSGQKQTNLVLTTRTAGGFVASNVLKAGTLYYVATLNT